MKLLPCGCTEIHQCPEADQLELQMFRAIAQGKAAGTEAGKQVAAQARKLVIEHASQPADEVTLMAQFAAVPVKSLAEINARRKIEAKARVAEPFAARNKAKRLGIFWPTT